MGPVSTQTYSSGLLHLLPMMLPLYSSLSQSILVKVLQEADDTSLKNEAANSFTTIFLISGVSWFLPSPPMLTSQVAQWQRIRLPMQEIWGSIPELGRSPEGGSGNPLQYSCLENPMDRGTWQAIVHGVAKSQHA